MCVLQLNVFDSVDVLKRRPMSVNACKDTLMGDTPIKLAATFRQNAKDRLVCVMIAGLGKGLLLAGLPSLSVALGGR